MKAAKAIAYDALLGARAWLNRRLDARWENDPFGSVPRASADEYLRLYEGARLQEHPQIDQLEAELGFAIERSWLDELALHTQIVKKSSDLAYPHGRLLYSLLRRQLVVGRFEHVSILETGTARGFSALCMAKALADSGVDGRIVSVDVLPHLKPQIWNCIDDHEGRKSRAELLAPWRDLTNRILFLQGDTRYLLPRIGMDRIHFAFLDAQHTKASVLAEFNGVAKRQSRGDTVFFDDVTPALFPGVVRAVDEITSGGDYSMRGLKLSEQRSYAWGSRR